LQTLPADIALVAASGAPLAAGKRGLAATEWEDVRRTRRRATISLVRPFTVLQGKYLAYIYI
jgi:hypothetical protein